MGQLMREYDVFIPSFLEMLNLRFAPHEANTPEWLGGVAEVAALQRELSVFQAGRSFQQSAALLGLGGQMNPQARTRWFALLDDLKNYESSRPGLNGDACIVQAMIENLGMADPLPVHFKAHDSRAQGGRRVIVGEEPRPVFYLEQDYLTVSLPMRPRARS